MIEYLETDFENREDIIAYVRKLSPWAEGNESCIQGGAAHMNALLDLLEPEKYGRTRNFGNGRVSRLSPYISRGIVSLNSVRNRALNQSEKPERAYKFIQELAWRDFWRRVARTQPELLWKDVETYKTGFDASEYLSDLPVDIIQGRTGICCIDYFINELTTFGLLHNHARMYLASYIVHFRRVRWQAGAFWFMQHLVDGDLASSNLSWQWVASTYSNRPYIFNLENVNKYFGDLIDTSGEANRDLNMDYSSLHSMLFPRLGVTDVE